MIRNGVQRFSEKAAVFRKDHAQSRTNRDVDSTKSQRAFMWSSSLAQRPTISWFAG
jgi:hypothetical protein